MSRKTWLLTDWQQDVYLPELEVSARDLGVDEPVAIRKRTLRGGKHEGVELIEIDNGEIVCSVLPTRGMGIWRITRGAEVLGWQSPVRGPIHPTFVPLMEPSGLGWLEGFDELLVRCGLESNGAPDFDDSGRLKYPLHGRIANLPACRLEASIDTQRRELSVTGVVEEARFHFQKLRLTSTVTLSFGGSGIAIRDEISNFGGTPATAQLLYHVNIGAPLLEVGARLVAPVKTLVPRTPLAAEQLEQWADYGPPTPGAEETVYFFDLHADAAGQTRVLLKNATSSQGVSLWFNKSRLPCFAQWKNPAALADGYVTGIEPATNFPNPRSFETQQGRVVKLAPSGTQAFDLRLDWHTAAEEIAAVEEAVRLLQQQAPPEIHAQPMAGWCA